MPKRMWIGLREWAERLMTSLISALSAIRVKIRIALLCPIGGTLSALVCETTVRTGGRRKPIARLVGCLLLIEVSSFGGI